MTLSLLQTSARRLRLFCAAALAAASIGAASAQTYVSASLNLRTKPSALSGRLTVIPRGAAITIDINGGDDRWVPVSYGRHRGYIQRRYITKVRPEPRHCPHHKCKKCDKHYKKQHKRGKAKGHHKH